MFFRQLQYLVALSEEEHLGKRREMSRLPTQSIYCSKATRISTKRPHSNAGQKVYGIY